ncbi:hypothetical protein [Kutzneria kofuensis]|uniref:hypothetical protein n=1 Tax=Kutzneria kofuensis TaxID=103725 RepID=UPI0031E68933
MPASSTAAAAVCLQRRCIAPVASTTTMPSAINWGLYAADRAAVARRGSVASSSRRPVGDTTNTT